LCGSLAWANIAAGVNIDNKTAAGKIAARQTKGATT
jgi:hypothetical protein